MITKKHALDDDFDSPRNVITGNNVDYLSYKFDEMDLAASWRVLTKQKLTIVNGLRLENASWRTWAKQRNNLKTVSPETLNWLKDSDVTWLYGPLQIVIENMDQKDRYAQPKKSTTEEMLGLITSQQPKDDEQLAPLPASPPPITPTTPTATTPSTQKPLKSALKKVKISDLLKRSVSELHVSTVSNDSDSISEANDQLGEFSPAVIASHRQPKLRFNQYVEQCIVVPPSMEKRKSKLRFSEEVESSSSPSSDQDDYEPDHDSDADSVVVMRKTSRIRSIKKIEPALLKTNSRSDYGTSDSSNEDDSDDGRTIPTSSSSSSMHHQRRRKKIDDENWDTESAQSDAFVQHILEASKGKERSRDPAADRMPSYPIQDEDEDEEVTASQSYPGKSDYEYSFDDDDWDTYSQHAEDNPFSFTANQEYAPIAPDAPVGVYPKHQEDASDNSLFSSIAHWASSHLWPPNNVDNNKH